MIKKFLTDLRELNKFAFGLAQRLWDNSPEAEDLSEVPVSLTEENIRCRVNQLADQIVQDYPDANPVLVGLMDGATPFASLLNKALQERKYNFNYTTMSVSSYGHKMVSGELTLGALPKVKLFARTVIVIDDVCDTGKTLKSIRDLFLKQRVDAVKLMVLVDKTQERPLGCNPDYVGFTLSPKAFIIGMGLDYLEELRNTTSIRTANPAFLPNEEEQRKLSLREILIKKIEAYIAAEALEQRDISEPEAKSSLNAPFGAFSIFGGDDKKTDEIVQLDASTSSNDALSV